MLQLLGQKYAKHVAFLLVSIFYVDFLGQLHATILFAREGLHVRYTTNLPFSRSPLNRGTETKPATIGHTVNNEKIQATGVAVAEKTKKFAPRTGPTQPESSSFQSANTDNLVDLFSGGFSYNVPLMDVGGYPVAIHYSSGITMDQEASWVGLGWNINPGAVSRTMRGLPDDFNGDVITKTESVKENKTVSVTGSVNTEIIGLPALKNVLSANLDLSLGINYNNYMGWGAEIGVSPSISSNIAGGKNMAGTLTAGLSLTSSSMYGVSVAPSLGFSLSSEDRKRSIGGGIGTSYNNRTGISSLQLHAEIKQASKAYEKAHASVAALGVPVSSYISFATPTYTPTISMPFKNQAYSFTAKVGGELWGVDVGAGISASVSTQTIPNTTSNMPAYGYMHFTDSKNISNALMDFNREKELAFNSESTPHIAIPVYTYDVFSISGEGIGGMFRPYRSDVGYIRDHNMQTTSGSGNLSTDIGIGSYVHAGADVTVVDASTTNEAWKSDNNLEPKLQFTDIDTTYEPVYFKNPGEQTAVDKTFFAALGDDDMLRASLAGNGEHVSLDSKFERVRGGAIISGYLNVNEAIKRKQRDKRTQLITYYSAIDAKNFGLDKSLLSYPENVEGQPVNINVGGDITCMPNKPLPIDRNDGVIRKGHHISEIDVLNNDGKRYVYGLPVYNIAQDDVTFSVDPVKKQACSQVIADKGLVHYCDDDATLGNTSGKDHYFSKQETPSYAHSFLLTGILSPDYVDIRGDGITDDDLGDAIRFNYTEVCGQGNPFQWRIPYSDQSHMANYNEGLKTDSRDARGSYTFGKKELWYLNSVESKNFVAVFFTSTDRTDAQNIGEEGGFINDGRAQRRLTRIDLYSKADLVKNGTKAKKIKSVKFEYDYSLCKNVSGDPNFGKLTLKAIWFSFNGGKWKNPYRFTYAGRNDNYNPARYDRWGNFKDIANNPGGMDNYDYPYVLQDSVKEADYAAAWSLTDIQTPAGGKIKVTYESDDYGYVQNKRASRLFKIDGFGVDATSYNTNIYEYPDPIHHKDVFTNKMYVFVTLPQAANTIEEVKSLYFEGITKLFFKLNVEVPGDKWGSGHEWVPLYTDIDDINFVANTNNTQIYIKVKDVDGMSPFKKVALQFLRLNLPSKAYPNSETGDNVSFIDMIKVIGSAFTQYAQMFTQYETTAQRSESCSKVELTRSFVRLDEPTFKRYGGGLRVKRIEIFDNWDLLTNGKHLPASYGQEYIYTTTQDVGGKITQISSGVASYEPQIGGDENPFRIAKELKERTNLLAPVNLLYSEEPLGESFFPSAMVGYSKVRVRTIHGDRKSANGWSETEYYTAKDFPTLTEMTPLDGFGKKSFRSKLTEFLKIDSRQYMNVSQGFKIELNDMNGKMKSQSYFAETDPDNPISFTKYYYKVDNNKADHQHLNNDVDIVAGGNGQIVPGTVGKDIEVMVDFRQQTSKTSTTNVGVNVDVVPGGPFPIPLPSAIPFPQKEIMRFRSAAVVKVINRYALLDSVVAMDKGSIVGTKNLVWDGEGGQAVITRTNNEFNDPVYNLTYPAYWAYNGMAPAYNNIDLDMGSNRTGRRLKIIKGKLYDFDNTPADDWEKFFKSGDEIICYREQEEDIQPITPMALRKMSTMGTMGVVDAPILDDALCGDPAWRIAPNAYIKLWAVNASEGKENNQGIYFIDQEGRPYSCYDIKIFRIIRSGSRNMMAANGGSLLSLANPIRNVNGVNKIAVDAQTKVLQANATTYKNLWKVVNHWYVKDSSYMQEDRRTVTLTPTRNVLMKRVAYSTSNNTWAQTPNNYQSFPSNFFMASNLLKWYRKRKIFGPKGAYFYDVNTLIDFDIRNKILGQDPDYYRRGNQLVSATMNLTHLNPIGVWSHADAPNCDDFDESACNDNFGSNRPHAHAANGATNGKDNTAVLENLTDGEVWRQTSTPHYNGPFYTSRNSIVTLGAVGDGTDIDRTGSDVNVLPLVSEIMNDQNAPPYFGWRLRMKDENTGDVHSSERTQSYQFPSSLSVTYNNFTPVTVQLCKQFISDTVVNPYRFGILGNWHIDRNYVYYSDRDDRRENDLAAASINLRTDGILTTFNPFWSFTDAGMQATTDTTQWKWNTAENFFNKKGYELENYDALGRYNAGQYGYNQQLATSATQNAKMRETFFDGFEDYDYKTNNCTYLCNDDRTFDEFTKTTDDSHTGLYSLSLPANQTRSVSIPLTNKADTAANLSIKVDSSLVLKETCTPRGTGLGGYYWVQCNGGKTGQDVVPNLNIYYAKGFTPANLCSNDAAEYTYRGKIQAPYTDGYQFTVTTTGGRNVAYAVTVGKYLVATNAISNFPHIPVPMHIGDLLDIVVSVKTERSHTFGHGIFGSETDDYDFGINVQWKRFNVASSAYENIPQQVLYPPDADASGTYTTQQFYCVKLNRIKPESVLLPKVAPIRESTVVVSAWVKIKDDNTNTANTNGMTPIRVDFTGSGISVPLQPTGVRIEGWQRYEAVKQIPANAANMQLVFDPGARDLLIDDIRIHPFNGNMKSFVYDPVSLRLMAELDENNYATYYEYDDEGNLMRLKKETERGIMTIKETRQNTQTTIQ